MKKLILVSCGEKKSQQPCKAKDMYLSTLFKAARAYAEKFGDYWYILSARKPDKFGDTCGWIHPDTVIKPYDRTLKGMSRDDLGQWVAWCQVDFAGFCLEHPEHVQRDVQIAADDCSCSRIVDLQVIVLAGKMYIEPFQKFGTGFSSLIEDPMKGLQIGERVQWLQQQVRGDDVKRKNNRGNRRAKGRSNLQQSGTSPSVPVGAGAGGHSRRRRSKGDDPNEPF